MQHPPPKQHPSQRPGIPLFQRSVLPSHPLTTPRPPTIVYPHLASSTPLESASTPSHEPYLFLAADPTQRASNYVPMRVHRVTVAQTPSYVERVVHVAACSRRWRCATLHARGHTALCLQWDGAWLGVCVYSTTGCTAESSRVESGAWWHRTCSGGVPPTRRRGTPTTQRGQCGTSTSTGGRWRADARRAASLRARCYAREGSGGRR
jgi:hypothetical protein